MFKEFADLAQSYSALIGAVATCVGAVATAIIAWFTIELAKENATIRKIQSNPVVTAFLQANPNGNGVVNFVVANVGQGPAFDVTFEFDGDGQDFVDHKVMLDFHAKRTPFSAIPAGDRIAVFFGLVNRTGFAGGSKT